MLGLKRVRLKREKPSAKLHRIAEAEILEDQESDQPLEPGRSELIGLFRALVEKRQVLDEDPSTREERRRRRQRRREKRQGFDQILSTLLDSALPLGVLSDIIAHVLGLPSSVKQALLSEPHVGRRVESLLMILHQNAGQQESKGAFPPPFSVN
ncbi:MAG: LON peptidase substrate-binding domain-containing protein [Isosphaerales bacterium]